MEFRSEKMNSAARFHGKTRIPRLGSKFRGPRKTVGPSCYVLPLLLQFHAALSY